MKLAMTLPLWQYHGQRSCRGGHGSGLEGLRGLALALLCGEV